MKGFTTLGLIALLALPLVAQKPKAIMINGNEGMITSVESTRTIRLLERNGYEVIYLEGFDATWAKVKAKAQGAAIFIYSGHGSNAGYNGTGGLCLNNLDFWGPDIIPSQVFEEEIQLAPGALVYFKGVCGGAGSSSNDVGDIGLAEACSRVSSYSYPFFNMGATAYFASNWHGDIEEVLLNLLAGVCLEDIFLNNTHRGESKKYLFDHTLDPTQFVWIAARYYPKIHSHYPILKEDDAKYPGWSTYNMAFSGNPQYTLKN